MNQKIKFLDPHEAIKIAAGEVVERPAHIVKELIENSIDASSCNITIHLQCAGKDLIKITDDGCGMSPEDAKLCFAHHATSKITTVNDLQTITTYGFRGEALSSIASVSHVELITKTETQELATHIKLEQAKFISQTQVGHQTGTTLIISHLFDNIPARKKFLKTDDTEWNLIITIFQAFCLRYLNINFKILHNDYLAYNCPATSQLKNRCAQLWSNQTSQYLQEINPITKQNITISGAISKINYHRFNRGQIFTFVNNRWVKNFELSKAILKGYDGVLPSNKFPAAFIFIDIDPTEIDINIHPKKEEIKFLHPGIVQRVIEEAVKQCLNNSITQTLKDSSENNNQPRLTSTLPMSKPFDEKPSLTSQNNFFTDHAQHNFTQALDNLSDHHPEFPIHHPRLDRGSSLNASENNVSDLFLTTTQQPTPQMNASIYEQTPCNLLGQFKKTYIMIEKSDGLILIDQHAAHERILYERFKTTTTSAQSVQLIFPHIVKLTPQDLLDLLPYQQLFEQHGILFEQFSEHEIIIQTTPIAMSAQSAQEIIQTLLAWAQQHQQLHHDDLFAQLYEKIIAEKACKSSCKAGDTLNQEQMQNIIKELAKTSNNFCCPHGRPTMWTMQMKDIEKQFKRDYAKAKETIHDLL